MEINRDPQQNKRLGVLSSEWNICITLPPREAQEPRQKGVRKPVVAVCSETVFAGHGQHCAHEQKAAATAHTTPSLPKSQDGCGGVHEVPTQAEELLALIDRLGRKSPFSSGMLPLKKQSMLQRMVLHPCTSRQHCM